MDFRGVVSGLAHGAAVAHAQAAIRAEFGRSASRWVAAQAGISPRTARRWLGSNPPTSRMPAILDLAGQVSPFGVAAQRLRGAARGGGGIGVGRVAVEYDQIGQGDRDIGYIEIDDAMARDLEAAAEALDNGDLDGAGDAFSDAIIGGYSPGLEETLSIYDYGDGIQLYD